MSNATQGRGGRWPGRGCPGLARAGLALVLATGLAGLPAVSDALGQSKGKAGEAAEKNDAAVQRAYAAGTRAFESGDMAAAERQLSTALAGGGLPSAQMARALYLRGAASRRLGKPAQAISDLTTAVWLKGGLSDSDKAKAMEERQLAYREAGLGDSPPPIGAAPLDQSPTATADGGAPAPKPGTQVAHVGQGSFWNNLSLPSISIPGISASPQQQAAAPAAAPQAPAAAPPPAQGFASAPAAEVQAEAAPAPAQGFAATSEPSPVVQTSAWETQTAPASDAYVPPQQQVAAASYAPSPETSGINPMLGAAPGAAPTPPPQQPAASAAEGQSSWNPFSGLFGNVFGSGSQASDADASPVTTGSTAAAATADWGSETTVATAQTSSMVQRGPDSPAPAPTSTDLPWTTAPAAPPATATPAAPPPAAAAKKQVAALAAPAGKYKLQVAAVRSREEADRLAQTLSGYKAVREGSVTAEVDEAVIGSMGTFYRVRLGPYADAKQPDALCQTLKPHGFDCLVVTQ